MFYKQLYVIEIISFCVANVTFHFISAVPLQPCSDIWDSHSGILPSCHYYDCPVHPHLPGLKEQGLQTQAWEERE